MLRASRIPPLLSRILGDGMDGAMLLTSDGELLGSAFTTSSIHDINNKNESSSSSFVLDAASMGALVAEVTNDYARAGRELLHQGSQSSQSNIRQGHEGQGNNGSELECLIIETELGRVIGVACCSFYTSNSSDDGGYNTTSSSITGNNNQVYYIAATGNSSQVGHGLVRARIMALEGYIRESLVQVSVYGNVGSVTPSNEAVVS